MDSTAISEVPTHPVISPLQRQLDLNRQLPPPPQRRRLRRRADVTLAHLAEHCGVSPQAVSSWERGEKQPKGEHLRKYVEALNLLRVAS